MTKRDLKRLEKLAQRAESVLRSLSELIAEAEACRAQKESVGLRLVSKRAA